MYAIIGKYAVEVDLSDADDIDYIETFVEEGTMVSLVDDYEDSGAELIIRD